MKNWGWVLLVAAACGEDVETSSEGGDTNHLDCPEWELTGDVSADLRLFTAAQVQQVLASCSAIASDLGSLGPVDGATPEAQLAQACSHAAVGIEARSAGTSIDLDAVSCARDADAEATCRATCGAGASCEDLCVAHAWIEGSCDTLNIGVTSPDAALRDTLLVNLPPLLVALMRAELVLGASQGLAAGITGAGSPEGCSVDVQTITSDLGAAVASVEAVLGGVIEVQASTTPQG